MEDFSNPKVKRIHFAFVLGNKDDQKILNNLLTAVVVVTARTTPPSGILPFHTVISFMFRRCDGGDMLVINASNNTGNPEGNSDYWVTSRRHRKMLSSERHLSD